MNKNLLLSTLTLTACAFADGDILSSTALLADSTIIAARRDADCNPWPKECKPKPKPCEPCVRKGMAPNVLTSSRPCSYNGYYLFLDALYWHADVGNSDWAFVNTGTPPVPRGSNKDATFGWHGGFRVGFGINLNHDEWDTNLYYTWFRSNGSHSFSVSPPSTGNTLVANLSDTAQRGTAKRDFHFNVLDWELGRWFYVSNSLSLRPHAGLKAAWNELDFNESFSGINGQFTTYSVRSETSSWAVGPSGGFNTTWYFGSGNTIDTRDGHRGEVRSRPHFSLFGDFAGALMFTHLHNSHKETAFRPNHLNRNLVVPVLQSIIGLAYDTCFDCEKYHFGLKLGYEFQWWFGQSQRLFVEAPSVTQPRYLRTGDDLGLQGLTVEMRFDF